MSITRRLYLGASAAALLQAWQSDKPIGITDLIEGKGFVRIPAGQFEMGSKTGNPDELPVRKVRITQTFEMGRYQVTQEQWDGVMRDAHDRTGTPVKPSHFQEGTGLPVESVSFEDVQLFLHRLNVRDNTHTYRLPTEAEWEYACDARGKETNLKTVDKVAWFADNSGKQTHPVGLKAPNAWGLYDMHGNVAEWVQDWYGRDYYAQSPASDPQGPATGSYRVYRGGCWFDPAKNCRAAYRAFDFPSSQYYNVGFRLVRTAKV